jgi:uncharacterized repeat protein (TIGR04042 family)
MHFVVEWPSGEIARCYSPSYVVEDYLEVGAEYPVHDFLQRVTASLTIASERVRARYGMACSSAQDQLAAIEAAGQSLAPEHRNGRVKVIAFEKHPSRDARLDAKRSRNTQEPE